MAKRYKVELTEGYSLRRGVTTWETVGEAVDVAGEPMIRLAHGTIIADRDFHDTLAEAKQEAARRIEIVAHRLLSQADELRAEAAKAEAMA